MPFIRTHSFYCKYLFWLSVDTIHIKAAVYRKPNFNEKYWFDCIVHSIGACILPLQIVQWRQAIENTCGNLQFLLFSLQLACLHFDHILDTYVQNLWPFPLEAFAFSVFPFLKWSFFGRKHQNIGSSHLLFFNPDNFLEI